MQFSLKSMMIFFVVVALLCAFSFTLPRFLSYIVLCAMLLMLPAALATGIVFGTEDQRAFAIGGSTTFGTMIWTNGPLKNLLSFNGLIGYGNSNWTGTILTVMLTFVIVAGAGAVAIWTRRRLVSRRHQPSVDPPPLPESNG